MPRVEGLNPFLRILEPPVQSSLRYLRRPDSPCCWWVCAREEHLSVRRVFPAPPDHLRPGAGAPDAPACRPWSRPCIPRRRPAGSAPPLAAPLLESVCTPAPHEMSQPRSTGQALGQAAQCNVRALFRVGWARSPGPRAGRSAAARREAGLAWRRRRRPRFARRKPTTGRPEPAVLAPP